MSFNNIKKYKIIILIGALSFLPLNNINIYANEQSGSNQINPRIIGDYYTWKAVGSHKVGTETRGGWIHFYTGAPATKDGEKDVASCNVLINKELTGNLKVTYKQLESILGYSVEKKESFSISKVSAPLKKGQYVKAYYMKNYTKHKVTQRQYLTTNGQTYATSNYAYVYSYKPLMPQIRLEYHNK